MRPLWLVEGGNSPWVWVLPDTVVTETVSGVTFLSCAKTWIALHPINIGAPKADDELTKLLTGGKDGVQWAGHQVLSATGAGGKFCGVAVEVGEPPQYADFAAFKKASLANAKVNTNNLAAGEAEFTSADGKQVRVSFATKPLDTGVWLDGTAHNWANTANTYTASTMTRQ